MTIPSLSTLAHVSPRGAELGAKAGTHGWTKDGSQYAVRENDLYALERIDEFFDAAQEMSVIVGYLRRTAVFKYRLNTSPPSP